MLQCQIYFKEKTYLKMSGIILSSNKSNPNDIESSANSRNANESDSDTVSDSEIEIEDNLSIENNVHEALEVHQGNQNFLRPTRGVWQSNSLNKNVIRNNITNITVQNSTNARVGTNETHFNAPVTIAHADIKHIYYSKKQKKYPKAPKKIIYFLISAVVIFSLLALLIIFLRLQDDDEDDDSDMSE